jgi:hypothetical protein
MIYKHKEIEAMAFFVSKDDLLPGNRMVKYVLLLKIAFTISGIIPYIFFSKNLIVSIGIPLNDSIMFIRSLGFAYLGFLLVYSSGFFLIIKKNIYPINIILFAIFNNSVAFILFLVFLLIGEYFNWGFNGKVMIYVSGLLFFFIALMLIISLIRNYKKYKNDIIWNTIWSKQS